MFYIFPFHLIYIMYSYLITAALSLLKIPHFENNHQLNSSSSQSYIYSLEVHINKISTIIISKGIIYSLV